MNVTVTLKNINVKFLKKMDVEASEHNIDERMK